MRRILGLAAAAAFAVCCLTAPGAARQTMAPAPSPSLPPRLTVSAEVLAGLPRRTVTVAEDRSDAVTYSGVELGPLLAKNGAPQGAALRGAAAADFVVVRASDGYRAVFALAECDPALSAKIILLADTRNGAPLDAKLGPFRIVVPDEKHHLRWVRNVVSVEIDNAP